MVLVKGEFEYEKCEKSINDGVVKGKKKGKASITAKIGKKKYVCKLTVETPSQIQTKISLYEGKSESLKLSGTKQKVTWDSCNKRVVTVSNKGL